MWFSDFAAAIRGQPPPQGVTAPTTHHRHSTPRHAPGCQPRCTGTAPAHPARGGVTNSSDGCFSASRSCCACCGSMPVAARSSICFCTSGVSTQPGQMALQVTLLVAVSRRDHFGQARSPHAWRRHTPLLPTEPTRPCTEAMLIIRPQPLGTHARQAQAGAVEHRRQVDGNDRVPALHRETRPPAATCWMPALLTRMSTPPNSRSA